MNTRKYRVFHVSAGLPLARLYIVCLVSIFFQFQTAPLFAETDTDFLLGVAFTGNGDTIQKFDTTECFRGVCLGEGSEKLRAGALVHVFGGGIITPFETIPIQLQLTAGYFVDRTIVEDVDSTFTRIPLEVMPYYVVKLPFKGFIRFGGGLTYHVSPKFTNDLMGPNVTYDDAAGLVFQVDYRFSESISDGGFNVGIRYVRIDYTPNKFGSTKIDDGRDISGNHFGLVFSFSFL